MKGYSVTVPATDSCPDASITDTARKTVYCKIGDRLRIAGFAEFYGHNAVIKEEKIQALLDGARSFLPDAGDYDTVLNQWCCLRPLTPDSLLIVGRSRFDNLYFDVGHGMLGWTHAMGTAFLLQKNLSQLGFMDTYPEFSPERFALSF